MIRNYSKPTIKSVKQNLESLLLSGSEENGIKVTISGYQSSDDDSDGFSQESDKSDVISQKSLWNY